MLLHQTLLEFLGTLVWYSIVLGIKPFEWGALLWFDRLVDSKVGFNPPFHSIRGPLDRSGPCGVKQATFSTHEERGPIILVLLYAGQSKTEGVVTGWMEVKQTNANSVEDIRVTRAKCNEEPRTVRAETGLH